MMKKQTLAWIGLAAALIIGDAVAAPYVVLRNGRRIDGTAIRALQNGDINLTTLKGIQTFPKGSYIQAVDDKPAEYDQAVAAFWKSTSQYWGSSRGLPPRASSRPAKSLAVWQKYS